MTRSIIRYAAAMLAVTALDALPGFLHNGNAAVAQPKARGATVAVVVTHDTLDTLSDWAWQEAFQMVVPMARSIAWNAIDHHTADSLAVLITGDPRATWWNSQADRNQGGEECHVLAWRLLRAQYDGRSHLMREALVSVALTDALGERHLVLALLDAEPEYSSKDEYRWQLAYPHFEYLPNARHNDDTTDAGGSIPMPKAHRDYVVTILPEHPGNEAVYQFVRAFDTMRATLRLGNADQYPGFFADLPLAPVEGWSIIGGGIRVETWKHVVGEVPSMFLPNRR